jgi:hypothetical protein
VERYTPRWRFRQEETVEGMTNTCAASFRGSMYTILTSTTYCTTISFTFQLWDVYTQDQARVQDSMALDGFEEVIERTGEQASNRERYLVFNDL